MVGLWTGFLCDLAFAIPVPYGHLVLVASTLAGLGSGTLVGTVARATVQRRTLNALRARLAHKGRKPVAIAACSEGFVQVRGRVRVLEPVVSPLEHIACAAYLAHTPLERFEQYGPSADPDQFESFAAVGALELDDGSGAQAIVRPSPCELLASPSLPRGELRIEDGVQVTVHARARWCVRPDGIGNYRLPPRFLELSGDAEHPMLLATG